MLLSLIVGSELLALFSKHRERLRAFAVALLSVLTFAAPLTYYSGFWGVDFANQSFNVSNEVIAKHQMFARFFLIVLGVCVLFRLLESRALYGKRLIKGLYLLFLLGSIILVAYTSWLGGELVFAHGAGVRAPENPNP